MARIVIIGAGSVEFTRNVIADLSSYEELHGSLSIVLHDIDAARLTYAERAAASIVRRSGAGYGIEGHADRALAIAGADYVINEIQVGGIDATLRDFRLPARYGLRQTIADTIGIGGIFRGLRTIPVMLGIGEDLHRLAPDALLLNYTNPMAVPAALDGRGPLPAPTGDRRCGPRRPRPPRPRGDLQALRLLPDGVQRALERVRPVVPARRR